MSDRLPAIALPPYRRFPVCGYSGNEAVGTATPWEGMDIYEFWIRMSICRIEDARKVTQEVKP